MMCTEKVALYRQLLEVKQTKSVKRLGAQWEAELHDALRLHMEHLLDYGAVLGYDVLAAELQRAQERLALEQRW